MNIVDFKDKNPGEYTTDKFGINASHNYGDFYNNLFKNKQDEKFSILEIGINTGGSVKLFHDYLINSNIIGIDITNKQIRINKEKYKRLNCFYFDAYNKNNWNILPIKKYDIIIDDGPHSYDNQLFFLNNFSELLDNEGILILEDTPDLFLDRLLNQISCDKSKINVYRYDRQKSYDDDTIITYKK